MPTCTHITTEALKRSVNRNGDIISKISDNKAKFVL